uniref:SusC/RagA family TonB-linked outer membrane protein n=1 Tax=Roseihalotalea indica TaxID=2867963 RepID=A0AA49GK87_9BACT|nr:SusC/RagA family TonB-linked outer membrane protein [Tunicatimonas sp. TK19036]
MCTRYTLLGLLLVCLVHSSLLANKAIAQHLEDVTISLHFDESSLAKAFRVIEAQTDFRFAYSERNVNVRRKISIKAENKSVREVLLEISRQTQLSFKQINQNILVKPHQGEEQVSVSAFVRVSGTVTDEAQNPIPGVNVNVEGTTIGTITDIDGNFNLDVPDDAEQLIFSFVGYETVEQPINGRSTIQVTLREDTRSLNEVVVTALGIERETRDLGYSVTKLENQEITRGGNQNLATAMAGKIPGLQLTRSTGPLGSSRIVLRGEASLNMENNRALIVIDGVPVTNDQNGDSESSYLGAPVDYGDGLSALNPEDIADITVLRGASAAALYGSQAANGVVMITTKSGKFNQDLTVNLRHTTSFQQVNRWLPRQHMFGSGNRSESDYYAFKDSPDGPQNRNGHSWGPKFMGQNFYQYDSPHTAVYDPERREELWEFEPGGQTPWLSHEVEQNFYKTGVTKSTGISVEAGNNNAYFRGSVDYLDNDYIMANTGYNRFNLALSSGVRTGKSRFSTKINYVKQASDNLPAEGYDRQNAPYQVFWLNANDDTQWYKDKLWLDGQEDVQQNQIAAITANPYWILYNSLNTLDKDRIFGKLQFDHDFTNTLKLTARSGIDFYTELRTRERAWSEPRNQFGNYQESTLKAMLLNTDVILSQNWSLGSVNLNGTLGFNHRYANQNSMSAEAQGLIIPGVFNIANAEQDPLVSPSRRQEEQVGVYGVINANYKDMIYLDVTGRNDWTSTLPQNNNSYFYPSAALAVDATEMFDISSSVLSYLKLRASVAQVGSDTDPYRLDRYYVTSTAINGGYSNPSTRPNAGLKPEMTSSVEFGFNAHFLEHRLNLDATFYKSETKNQILNMPVDPASGYLSALMNAGAVSNRGIELQLTAKPIYTPNFTWDIAGNWSANRGRVEELVPGIIDTYILGSYIASRVLVKAEPGEQMGRIYGKGYDKHNGQIIFKDGLAQRDNDEDYLGNVFPDWRAGIINTVRYKNFHLSFQFDYQQGGRAYSITHFLMNYTGKAEKTVYGRESGAPYESGAEYDMASGAWIQNEDGRFGVIGDGVMLDEESGEYVPNTVSAPAPYYYNAMYERDQIEGNVFETTFLKLRNLRLAYDLPAFWRLKGAQVAVYGNELFIWTKFPAYDPEQSVVDNGTLTPGLEATGSPSTRTVGIDLKVTF